MARRQPGAARPGGAARPVRVRVHAPDGGRADTCAATIGTDLAAAGLGPPRSQAELADRGLLPAWIGDDRVHRSHRSALVRKDPEFYGPLFPDADPALEYVWPV